METVTVAEKQLIVDSPKNGVEYAFSIRDGIGDDVARVSDSIAYGTHMRASDIALTLAAAVSAAYIGIHAFRFFGFRTDLGGAVGAVAGGIALDAISKRMVRQRLERVASNA